MRVVRLITRLNRGGPLRQLEALVPGLSRRGIEGPVWVGEPEPSEEDASDVLRAVGAEVEIVPGLSRGIDGVADSRAFRWLRARLARERPDVLHTHLSKAGALGRLAAASAGVPVRVHTFHGHHLAAPPPLGIASRLAERGLAALSTAAVCLSPRQREDLVEHYGVLPASKAAVVGPGLDVARLLASVDTVKAAAIRERFAPAGGALFLWLGRFVPTKDPLSLVDAAAAATRHGAVPAVLVMAGDGPLAAASRARAAAAGALGRVRFVGPVADPATWIAASDVVALSSRSEGTPLSLLEAQVLGVPVVSPAVGGVPDVVEDGVTGLLVPPGDVPALAVALARLASDPGLRAILGARAKASAPLRFSGEALSEATAALYHRLLSGAPAGPEGASPMTAR